MNASAPSPIVDAFAEDRFEAIAGFAEKQISPRLAQARRGGR